MMLTYMEEVEQMSSMHDLCKNKRRTHLGKISDASLREDDPQDWDMIARGSHQGVQGVSAGSNHLHRLIHRKTAVHPSHTPPSHGPG